MSRCLLVAVVELLLLLSMLLVLKYVVVDHGYGYRWGIVVNRHDVHYVELASYGKYKLDIISPSRVKPE